MFGVDITGVVFVGVALAWPSDDRLFPAALSSSSSAFAAASSAFNLATSDSSCVSGM
jgi:hypothetical protein